MKFLFSLITFLGISFCTHAQCDSAIEKCSALLSDKFISDGQQYRALLVNGEVAEFSNTFYGGSTYRITAGAGKADSKIIYRVYDGERNLLFDSAKFKNTEYWDFKFNSTLNCTIEAQMADNQSGCAVLLIGFRN